MGPIPVITVSSLVNSVVSLPKRLGAMSTKLVIESTRTKLGCITRSCMHLDWYGKSNVLPRFCSAARPQLSFFVWQRPLVSRRLLTSSLLLLLPWFHFCLGYL